MLAGRRILLGLSGGIACYRSAELVRLLREAGAEVRCIMTRAAGKFITPLTMEALSGAPVGEALFSCTTDHRMGHIELARWADLLVIAPATADLMAKLAAGVADDLLTTVALVCERPLLLAPAMNRSMWQAAATQRNVARLRADGAHISGPEAGALACGEEGPGRMRTPSALLEEIVTLCTPQRLRGSRWVVTTGPTWERWDDVRILTSRASGRLGAHIAGEAARYGAEVTLIAGPGTPSVEGVDTRAVESAREMLRAALEETAGGCDLFLAAAAVADYRVARPHAGKLKRETAEAPTLQLERNPDIVATVAASGATRPRRVVAFAAEAVGDDPQTALAEGWRKLTAKQADAIVVNDIADMGAAGHDRLWWLTAQDAPRPITGGSKQATARAIVQRILDQWPPCTEQHRDQTDGIDHAAD